ncbi:MAG: type II toxin-antitoxin system RelE/ParE family toxin [Alphaproteobacteria bacterium]|nr:type II toxin-antitoxin system RelE/ParE family toxin [Alphaproteobacteria bacterium]MCW5741945.1 type II toxin-antitoxin system RelE/ParE family toxin [Alphaproteobacteria bacterium]
MFEIRQTAIFRRWVEKLRDRRAKAMIAARIARFESGNPGDVESVGGGVSEMRIHHGPGYRLYFVLKGATVVILLCGGDKGSQKADIV